MLPRRTSIHFCAGALLILGMSGAAADDERQPGPHAAIERATVELVLIDAHVTDRHGRPITGLEIDDFVLKIDGRIRPIASIEFRGFDPVAEPDDSVSEQVDGAPVISGPPRRLVLFFDDLTSNTSGLTMARRAAVEFLDDALLPTDVVAALAYGRRLRVLHDFTTDHRALRRAIETSLDDSQRVSMLALERRIRYEELMRGIRDGKMQLGGDPMAHAAFLADSFATIESRPIRATFEALTSVVDALAPWPGYRAIVFMSDGLPKNPATPYFEMIYDQIPDPDLLLRASHHDLSLEHTSFIHAAAGAGVVIHTLKTDGLQVGSGIASTGVRVPVKVELNESSNRINALAAFSLNTGGIASISNDLVAGLRRVEAASRDYYLLGYAPEGPPDGVFHSVQLRVKRSGTRLRWRRGFRRLLPADARIHAIQAAHMVPELHREMAMEIAAIPGPADATGRMCDLVVHLPPGEILFLPGPSGSTAHLEVGMLGRDGGSGVVLRVARRVTIARKSGDLPLGINLFTRLRLPANAESITGVIEDLSTGTIGAARLALGDDFAGTEVLSLSLYSLSESSLWVGIDDRPQEGRPAGGRDEPTVGPALKGRFGAHEPIVCGFRMAHAGHDSLPVRLQVRRDAEVVMNVEVEEPQSGRGGAYKVPLPEEALQPGTYRLYVQELTDGGAVDRAGIDFIIEPPAPESASR